MEVVNTTTTTDPVNMYNYLNNLILNPIVFIIIFLIIVAYFVFSSSLGNNNTFSLGNNSSTNDGSNIIGVIIISILVILILVNAFQYFFSINVTAYINGLFTPTTTVDIVVDQSTYKPVTVPEIKFRKQVFNVPGNNYNYENAKAICNAYGSNLATYKQIEDAYENGAEWCNYGWSQGQMALFPTQQQTYDKLQTIDGHNHDCGRPGINGGYIANPEVKFGVNCYGYKPKINEEEEELMKTSSPYPETTKDLAFQKRVDYWKNNIDDVLVSPFNNNRWSEL
jgi:heme/copper-type cytochrome/quinol oxidase subunit 2